MIVGQPGAEPLEPLPHRCGRGQRFTAAVIATAPADQQVAAGREQRLHQDVAVLVRGVGIAELGVFQGRSTVASGATLNLGSLRVGNSLT
ncbi:MAG: hypothetical protein ACK56F_22950, partial [bacterium]